MTSKNIIKNNQYINTQYNCSCCSKLSYEYETSTFSPKIIHAVESFLYYDNNGDIQRTQVYICPHCKTLQLDID